MSKLLAKHDSLIFELIEDVSYQINEDGSILKRIRAWDKKLKKELWKPVGYLNEEGYRIVAYKGALLRGHRIIFAKFKGYLRKNLVINHIDENRSNNAISNLELVTQKQNHAHSYDISEIQNFLNSRKINLRPRAKLSWNQVDEIKAAWGSKEYTMTKLAEKYGVNISNISRAINGKQFKHRVDKNNG